MLFFLPAFTNDYVWCALNLWFLHCESKSKVASRRQKCESNDALESEDVDVPYPRIPVSRSLDSMALNSRYTGLLRHISLSASWPDFGGVWSPTGTWSWVLSLCLDGIISIGHIYFHGSLIVRLSKHGNTFKIAMKSGKWDARANKMPIFYGQTRDAGEWLAGGKCESAYENADFQKEVVRGQNWDTEGSIADFSE